MLLHEKEMPHVQTNITNILLICLVCNCCSQIHKSFRIAIEIVLLISQTQLSNPSEKNVRACIDEAETYDFPFK